MDYWRDLHDPFWRCERGHRLARVHVRLCDSGGNIARGWYISAGVHSAIRAFIEVIESNPALGVKRFKGRGEGFHTWTEAEVEQFQTTHALGSKPRLALELLLNTGQRREDMVRMGRQHLQGDEIAVRQEKTDAPLMIPIPPTVGEGVGGGSEDQHDVLAHRIWQAVHTRWFWKLVQRAV